MHDLGSVRAFAAAAGGRLIRGGPGGRPVHGVAIDTRRMPVGGVFFALQGPQRDGHHYVQDAAAKGAAAVVVSRLEPLAGLAQELAVILVPDVVAALARVARCYREELNSQVVAITGTCGKSTTKQMLGAILSAAGPTSASPSSFNNHLGVPLSMLMAPRDTRYLVLELGANHPGEISALSRLAAPELALITNIGPGHLEGLGDLAGVARAKREILDGLSDEGQVVLSTGDLHSRRLARTLRAAGRRVHTVGEGGELSIAGVEPGPRGLRFRTSDGAAWQLDAPGGPAVTSALAAIAVARALGAGDATIARGLARYEPLPMRLEVFELAGGVTLINDCYNANPLSVGAAVDYLVERGAGRRKIAVLGEMLELGPRAAEWHATVGRRTGERVDLVWGVGPSARETARGAGGAAATLVSRDAGEVAARIADVVRDGDVVLVKGSRGMQMERVSGALVSAREMSRLVA